MLLYTSSELHCEPELKCLVHALKLQGIHVGLYMMAHMYRTLLLFMYMHKDELSALSLCIVGEFPLERGGRGNEKGDPALWGFPGIFMDICT